jgi:hypothetical protein
VANRPEHVQLEIPRFGEFARQYADISSKELRRCLALQRRTGNRLGAIMVEEGYLTTDEVTEVLRRQAQWAARMHSREIARLEFPLPTPLSLCLPCYNEQDVIAEVLAGIVAVLPEFVEEFEVVVVDDGSQDATSNVVERFALRDDRVRLVRHAKNRGYGAAVSTALRAAHGEWICFTDGDGQFNMLDLPRLLVNAAAADVVIGYRHNRADNGVRKFNATSWKWLIRCLLGLRVRDLDCAFKLFPRWVVDCLQLNSEGACISAEILTQCVRGGVSIAEVPVNHFPRCGGKATGANLGVVMKAFRELPIVWQYRKMTRWTPDRRMLKDPAARPWAKRRRAAAPVPSFLVEPLAGSSAELGAGLPMPTLGER